MVLYGVQLAPLQAKGGHHPAVARQGLLALNKSLEPLPGDLGKALYRPGIQPPSLGFFHYRPGQGMFRQVFQREGQLQKRLLLHAGQANQVGNHRFSGGDGAGLVQYHGLDVVGGLQCLGGLEQDAVAGAPPSAHHNGGGGCQSQCAGTGHHQHRHHDGEGEFHPRPGDEPGYPGHQGDGDDHRHKHPGHPVGQFGNGRFGTGGLVHQADDLGQGGFVPTRWARILK